LLVRVRVYYDTDFAAWRRDAERGLRPGLAPYGLEHLAGDDIWIVPRQPPRWATGRLLGKAVASAEWRTIGLVQPFQLLRGREDVALAILEREGWGHALLKKAGVAPWSRVPLVLVSCWLADEARRASRARLALLRVLATAADLIVYWSRNQEAIFRTRLGVDEHRLCFVPFGVETEFYTPVDGPREPFVLTVGLDRGRDWPTFIAAANLLGAPVKVVSRPAAVAGLTIGPEVELLGRVDHVELRRLMRRATLVAVAVDPDTVYPTGQTVVLNAMAVGTPVVVTDTVPMRDYLRHGENAWVVPARDPEALSAGMRRVLDDGPLRQRLAGGGLGDVRERFNAATMWAAVAARLRGLPAWAAGEHAHLLPRR
jgi:glycosyltransferase involved in cell wall biosynthesis